MADWTDKKITVLGLGRSGVSAASYLAAQGASVFVSEASDVRKINESLIKELEQKGIRYELGGHSAFAIEEADLIVVSPGVAPTTDVIVKARKSHKEVICDIELAFRETKIPIIAVTGTNGKSTTCALISHLLKNAGLSAPVCGNFGIPILSQLSGKHHFLVAEVSSYQLEYCKSFSPAIAVWLNLTADHLDWHGGLDSYIAAKRKIFAQQTMEQFAVFNSDDPIVAESNILAHPFPFSLHELSAYDGAFLADGFFVLRMNNRSTVLCHIDKLKILGKHNIENCLAALSVAAIAGLDHKIIVEGLTTFVALEHRLEYVDTINGIAFYNDSKATNVDSAIKALESFPAQKIVLIAGGKDKGTDLAQFVESVKIAVSDVILLGEAKTRFEAALTKAGFKHIHVVDGMESAVDVGLKLGQGPVVLSPACASFDMFKDYEERGRTFKNIVRARRA